MKLTATIAPARAFVRMGYIDTISYPLSSLVGQLGAGVALISIFFLSRIIREGPSVGGSYVTFVLLGLVGQTVVTGAFQGISQTLDYAIQQGRLETILIEPISWSFLPVALGLWPAILQLIQVGVILLIGLVLGVSLNVTGLPEAAALVLLGVLAGFVLGVFSAAVRVLAKRSDPLWLLYSFAAGLLSGTTVPINVLPLPLRVFSWLLPTTYVNAGLRQVLMPTPSGIYGPEVLGAAAALVGFVAVGGIIALCLFRKSLNAGRRLGVLAGY